MRDLQIWQFMAERLRRGTPTVLMIVVETEGSTPGKPGFKMAVGEDGSLSGTVGGGKIEHDLVELAREMLRRREGRAHLWRLVHRESAAEDSSGMICGGVQKTLLCPCQVSDLDAIERIQTCVERGKPGRLCISPEGLSCLAEKGDQRAPAFVQSGQAEWRYEEPLGSAETVYIVGGGHVGLALSRVLATLDFRIVVLDERPDVETMQRNLCAHERRVLPFDQVGDHIPEGDATYVVVMTPSHGADECALRQLAGRQFRYLGMMASTTKARQIFARMKKDDFSEEVLGRIYSPIGLPISSHTPAEIAVSIAAEIIKVRNT